MMRELYSEQDLQNIQGQLKKRGIINMQEFEKSLSAPNDITSSVMAWKAINMEAWMQLFYDGRGVVEV